MGVADVGAATITPRPDDGRPLALKCIRVAKSYTHGLGTVHALAPISLEAAEGEFVALVGVSGSGKTTLLNVLAGLERPSAGDLRVLDRDLGAMSDSELTEWRSENIGLVFQEPHLLPGLTALENVVLARLPWSDTADLTKRSELMLDSLGLSHRLHTVPALLSAGEQQRVSIARALIGQPRLLFADEPSAKLDLSATQELLDSFEQLRQRAHLTLLIATHDTDVAARADRVIHLSPSRD